MRKICNQYKKLSSKRIKGYALFFAIFIFAVVVILSSTLILSAYYNNHFYNRVVFTDKLYNNAASGINLLLIHPDIVTETEPKLISLYQEYGDSIKLEKEQWGVFDLFTVTAFHEKLKVKRSAIIGNYKYDSTNVALFVADQGKPISITGNAEIKGNCVLPESGFKRAYIEGKNFTGSRMVDGKIKKSASSLPELNNNIAKLNVDFFLNKYVNNSNKVIAFEDLKKDTLAVSFQDSVTILYSSSPITLDYLFLQGKIIVLSEQNIHISNNANLNDIICVAPSIQVENDFSGKLQLFARDSIIIEENCHLKYPSVIGITIPQAGSKSPYIRIEDNTIINGLVFIHQGMTTLDKQPVLRIAKEAIIKGQAYCNGYTEIKGSVYGALYTTKFILSTASSIYDNMLMDADIDIFKLSSNYVGVDFINEQTQGSVIKWVY